MTLMRFNRPDLWNVSPFEHLNRLRDEIDRLFDGSMGEANHEFFNGWAPALDLREDKDKLVAVVELPGMRREDIEVSVHDGVLSICGERKREQQSENEAGAHRTERFYGRFHRTLSLPKPVQLDAIKASYKDGILTVSMPKTEEAKPRQIEVNVS